MVLVEEPDPDDLEWLNGVVGRHRDETGSEVARRLLGDWSGSASSFVKVMPLDFKRVLEAAAAARAAGRDEVAAVMAVAHG